MGEAGHSSVSGRRGSTNGLSSVSTAEVTSASQAGNSASASGSFRSNWQQMLATLDEGSGSEAPGTAAAAPSARAETQTALIPALIHSLLAAPSKTLVNTGEDGQALQDSVAGAQATNSKSAKLLQATLQFVDKQTVQTGQSATSRSSSLTASSAHIWHDTPFMKTCGGGTILPADSSALAVAVAAPVPQIALNVVATPPVGKTAIRELPQQVSDSSSDGAGNKIGATGSTIHSSIYSVTSLGMTGIISQPLEPGAQQLSVAGSPESSAPVPAGGGGSIQSLQEGFRVAGALEPVAKGSEESGRQASAAVDETSTVNLSGTSPSAVSVAPAYLSSAASASSSASGQPAVKPQIASERVETSIHAAQGASSQTGQQVVHIGQGQVSVSAVGAPIAHETGAAQVTTSAQSAAGHAGPGASTADTFSALDGAGEAMHTTWTHAGPHNAEAGFNDPQLGWVSVRAGLGGGGITAEVVPNSAEAGQALGAHMAGLNNYLADRHTPVASLSLASAQSSGSDAGLSRGMEHQGTQDQGQRQSGQDNTQAGSPVAEIPVAATARESASASSSGVLELAPHSAGVHISVMA